MSEFILETKKLKKYYGKSLGIEDVSIKLKKGDIYGFIGPNGAGKSTTIKMITGILDIDEGDILINNNSIKENPIEAKKLDY